METLLAEVPEWARVLFYIFVVLFGSGLFVYGKLQPAKKEQSAAGEAFEIKAAIVDSKAVDRLTAAVEAATMEAITERHEAEKVRKLGYELGDTIEKMATELHELRTEIRMLGERLSMRR